MATVVKPPCDHGVISSAPAVAGCAESTGRWVLAATIIGSSMVFIDGSVVNVALPVLQKEMNATIADAQWIVEAYALLLAGLILVGGSLGDHFGRKRIFGYGVWIFAAGSLWCALSANVAHLILARAVQGVGGALLVPGSLAIISASFSPAKRGRAIGTWSGFLSISSSLGPLLGGWLVQHLSWRWAFLINLPLAAAVLVIVYLRVPESRDEELSQGAARRLDFPGAALATLGLGAAVYGLITAGSLGLGRPEVAAPLALSVLFLGAFVAVEARSPAPMLPLQLFRSRDFAGANILTFCLYAALSVVLFYLPFNLIQVQGYGATAAGAALLPFILIMFALSRWSGGLVNRYGARLPLVAGPIVAAVGLALFARSGIGGSYWTTFFPASVILGIGMAVSVAPLTTTVMDAAPTHFAGIASAVNNAVSRTAALVSIAVLSLFMQYAFNRNLDQRAQLIDLPAEARNNLDGQRTRLAEAMPPAGLGPETTAAVKRAVAESYVAGFRVVALIGAGLALAGALSAALSIGGGRPIKKEAIGAA